MPFNKVSVTELGHLGDEQVFISFVIRDFSTALQKKDRDEFYKQINLVLIFLAVALPVYALRGYIPARLSLGWRDWLTKRMMRFLSIQLSKTYEFYQAIYDEQSVSRSRRFG